AGSARIGGRSHIRMTTSAGKGRAAPGNGPVGYCAGAGCALSGAVAVNGGAGTEAGSPALAGEIIQACAVVSTPRIQNIERIAQKTLHFQGTARACCVGEGRVTGVTFLTVGYRWVVCIMTGMTSGQA